MSKNKNIFIKQWLELKPYEKQTATDAYYLKLCNDIKKAITSKHLFILSEYFDTEHIDFLSCFLVSYFEDIISETNIWNSFIKKHHSLYNKKLPFYNTNEYYDEEINEQDISFLIWYFFNTAQTDKFINSDNYFFAEMASKVMVVLDEAYEYAPENKDLKTFYQIDENESDFYVARNLIDTVLFKTYLFYTDTLLDLREKEAKILEEIEDEEHIMHYLNENRDLTLHTSHTRILSLTGKEWVSNILGEKHSLSDDFLKISKKISGYFLYKGQDERDIFLEHIASSKKFNLTKKSFDHHQSLKEVDSILYMGIAMWRDEWWFSGVFFQSEFNPDLILDEKNSMESRMAVNFLDHQTQEIDDIINSQLEAFKDYNNGSPIAFMPSDKIESFVRSYTEYFNKSLNLSAKEKAKAKQRAREDGFFGTDDKQPPDYSEVSETGLVFFNPKNGVEIALAVNSAFPLAENNFFEIEKSTEHIMRLLFTEELSTELAMYCIDNCKTKLPFFNEGEGKKLLDDINFLLRFWKKNSYHTIPSITFTGKKED